MSNVDDIKKRLKREPETIIIEEDEVREDNGRSGSSSLVDEMGRFGRKLAENAQNAIARDQADKLQDDLRRGWEKFSSEANRVVTEMREDAQNAAEKIRSVRGDEAQPDKPPTPKNSTEASGGRSRVNIPRPNIDPERIDDAKENMAKGLRWLSGEMGKLANRYQDGGNDDDDLSSQINIDP